MRLLILPPVMALAFVAVACGSKDSDDGDNRKGESSSGAIGEITDSSADGLKAFVTANTHRAWTDKQPAPIASSSAHGGMTQTFFNPTAAAALRAGQTTLPSGSIVAKDLFQSDGTTLKGYALMAKGSDGVWLWYEAFSPDFDDPYYGKNLSTCAGCHSSGTDSVRTALPE